MEPTSLTIIREEHAVLVALLRSVGLMVARGPGTDRQNFFDVLSAMLFYIDEFPERLHHPKETELLFPRVAHRVPEVRELIARLDGEHAKGESAVRALQHLLMAWHWIGDSRRAAFETAAGKYQDFYLEHIRQEESVVLPAALKALSAEEWQQIDAAFATNCDPLTGRYPRDPVYDRLFTQIVTRAPAPIGVGADT
jgi:hemerythrin-like domain-containing protein